MAALLPPRKNPTPTKIHRQNLSPLDTLTHMGFSQPRAEKALAATGHRNVQLASDWLLAHVNDPTIDNDSPRDYILYLCPVGELQQQLSLFWQKSKYKVGWNGAHNSFPHITLSSSFKCPDSQVQDLMRLVAQSQQLFEEWRQEETKLALEKYMSPNFFGLFVEKEQENLLKKLTQELCKEVRKLGLKADPIIKSFHLTLAYQFAKEHFSCLEQLAQETISVGAPCSWELRLYSYDSRTAGCDVYKVLYAHVPREDDELELVIGDYIFITQEEWSSTSDGWVVGISFLRGSSGYLPTNYVERTAETNAWTLHTVLPCDDIPGSSETHCDKVSISEKQDNNALDRLVEAQQECDSRSDHDLEVESLYAKVVKPSNVSHEVEDDDGVSSSTPTRPPGPRQLFITRHGERVDFTFGPWIPYSWDKEGRYQRKDLNMPVTVPERREGPDGFSRDCPLTVVGTVQAKLVGEAMRDAGIAIHHVFCSPSLRCVQTCHGILSGLGVANKLKINIEPGLFEWLAWYQDGMPSWMTASELMAAGYNVDPHYKPYISSEELHDTVQESVQQFYIRNFFITQCALQATEEPGGNVLLVGHAATLDTCSRQLVGKETRGVNEMMGIVRFLQPTIDIVDCININGWLEDLGNLLPSNAMMMEFFKQRKVPYCSVAMLEENPCDDGTDDLASLLGGRSSPGCISSVSLMSRSTARSSQVSTGRTPAPPPPKTWSLVQPPFPPMTHTSVNTFDWKLLLDKE